MSAGLAASTVTPGSTPPELSVTSPAIELWADAVRGTINGTRAPTKIAARSLQYIHPPRQMADGESTDGVPSQRGAKIRLSIRFDKATPRHCRASGTNTQHSNAAS